MLKLKIFLVTILIFLVANSNFAGAASAVLIKFTDKTDYKEIGTAEILSDLIAEKLLASGKFRLKESYPIDISAERKLYEKDAAERDNAKIAMETGDLDALFSNEGFDKNKAPNIDTAVKGQIVQPELTRAIGEKNGVEYLIQGTVEGFANYSSSDDTIGGIANLVGGDVGVAFKDAKTEKKFLAVAVSLRIIEAKSGKVLWNKKIIGQSHVSSLKNDKMIIGKDKLQVENFHKALNEAAENIVKAMLEDTDSQKFFQ